MARVISEVSGHKGGGALAPSDDQKNLLRLGIIMIGLIGTKNGG
jgi:hypothetical protein